MQKLRRRIKTISDLFKSDYMNVTPTGCWEWTGRRDRCGYGFFIRNGKQVRVTRAALEHVGGQPLGNLHALHHCDNPPCFRPDHLFAGTHRDNMQDALLKGRKTGVSKLGRSGVRGVIWVTSISKWRVIRYQASKMITYGEFKTLAEAISKNAQLEQGRG